jgi:hypothetical protein
MRRSKLLFTIIAIIVVVCVTWAVLKMREKPGAQPSQKQAAAVAPTPAQPGRPASTPPPSKVDMSWLNAGTAKVMAQPYPDFQLRPLPVAIDKGNYQWTNEDAMSPDVIKRLAHNDLEYLRMMDENSRINRRQLVYIKQPVATLIEQAKLTGEKVKSLTLPGFDGQEMQFEITSSEVQPSGQIGSFSGHLAGDTDTTITLAYKFGREAFTIVTPENGENSIDAEPREPGQVILKSVNPNVYQPLPDRMILRPGPPGTYPPGTVVPMPGMDTSGTATPAAK